MNDRPRIIKVSEDSLESFAVFDSDFYDITLLPLSMTNNSIVECSHYRKFTLEDMELVLEKLIEKETETAYFFFAWYEPLIAHLYDNLMLDTLFGDYPGAIDSYRLAFMPQSDDDLLSWMLAYMLQMMKIMSPAEVRMKAADYLNAEALLHMIDLQGRESFLPVEEREYIDEIMDDFTRELDNDLILKEADRFTKKLFIKYVNILCDHKNFNALRIKGFACLGGNSVFKSDYREGARCMEILWKEGGFGYAANTLGFIYYEGRLNGGIPDFGEAFRYFSIGHTFGVSESTYKLAQMFTEGIYVAKNTEMAASLLEHLYIDTRIKFEQEDFECSFAEAAVHMGRLELQIYREDPSRFLFMRGQALDLYLQAGFALKMRSQFGMSAGDRKLQDEINAVTAELLTQIKVYKSSYKSDYPDPLREFFTYRPYGAYSLTLKRLKNDRLKITVGRIAGKNDIDPPLTLMTYPEFACCVLTDKVSLTAGKASVYGDFPEDEVIFDDLAIEPSANNNGTLLKFYRDKRLLITIRAENFTVTKP